MTRVLIALSVTTSVTLGAAPSIRPLVFSAVDDAPKMTFLRTPATDPYLVRLKTQYSLDAVTAGKGSDYERARALGSWVRSRWDHHGRNVPQKRDPISILEEAAAGSQFRCVEYAQVLSAALNAVGIPARVVGLMMADAATREVGAGHVVTEAWLPDRQKWIMIDPQWDITPELKGRPLNAVEFQQALASRAAGLSIDSRSGTAAERYYAWIAPYLFYFRIWVDARIPTPASQRSLILVPQGAPPITVFQRSYPIADPAFTHSLATFYGRP